jgi:hypothetical protein
VLIGSHIVGVAPARYAVEVEPIHTVPPDRVVDLLAPTFQRFLTEPLEEAPEARRPPAAAPGASSKGSPIL